MRLKSKEKMDDDIILKKILILSCLIVVVLLVGCTTPQSGAVVKKDGKTILKEAVKNAAKFTSFEGAYSITYHLAGISIPGTMHIYSSEKNLRSDLILSFMGKTREQRDYYLEKDRYSCERILAAGEVVQDWSCNVTSSRNPLQLTDDFAKFADTGLIKFGDVETKTILSKTCDKVRMSIDAMKMREFGSLFEIPDDEGFYNSMKDLSLADCFDTETGLELEFEMEITMALSQKDMTVRMSGQATSITPDAQIPPSVFTLPAEPVQK